MTSPVVRSKLLTIGLMLILLAGCTRRQGGTSIPEGNRYATGFRIEQRDTCTLVEVFSPQTTYIITQPIRRMATASCTHIGFIDALGQLPSIVAVCNKDLVYTLLPDSVLDAGDSMSPNVEVVMRAGVDGVMVSTYAQGDRASEQFLKMGLQVIYNNEWQESSPLARAEWIRFVGAFYGCLPLADSIFGEVEQRYLALAEHNSAAQGDKAAPKILSGNNFRGTWYVPSGNTYMGNLFRDAGADYPYYDDLRQGSIPLTIEKVLSEFSDADVWVGSNGHSMDELSRMYEKHTWFRAYQTGRVYNWYKQTTPSGGNNFWERGVVHPEEILQDLIAILSFAPDSTLVFAEHLQ